MAMRVKTFSGTSIAIPGGVSWVIIAATATNTGGSQDLTFVASGGTVKADTVAAGDFVTFVGAGAEGLNNRVQNPLLRVFHTSGSVTCTVSCKISVLERDVP